MKRIAAFVLIAAAGMFGSGCATILNQKTQPVNLVVSNGTAVEGRIDGMTFKGPGIINITRENKDKVIEVSTPGCTQQTSLAKEVDPKFFINILSGGVFGSTTDYATEKMWRYASTVTITCKE